MMTSVLRDSLGGNCSNPRNPRTHTFTNRTWEADVFGETRSNNHGRLYCCRGAPPFKLKCGQNPNDVACRLLTSRSLSPHAAACLQYKLVCRILAQSLVARLCSTSCSDHQQCPGKRGRWIALRAALNCRIQSTPGTDGGRNSTRTFSYPD